MKIKVGFLTVCTLLTYLLSNSLYAATAILAATLHEFGHIGMARACGISFRELCITPFGAALTPTSFMGTYREEMLVAAAGPFVNLLCAALIFPLRHISFFFFFLLSSLFFALLNLLPVSGFDGGRILFCLLCQHFTPEHSTRVLSVSSFLIVFALWSFSVYVMLRVGSSLSLFIFSCSLFLKLFIDPQKTF